MILVARCSKACARHAPPKSLCAAACSSPSCPLFCIEYCIIYATLNKERGLELSEEKTRITHIEDGFDFLGYNVRKYAGKLLIKPSKVAVKRFLDDIRELIKASGTDKTEQLIRQLNLKLRGWANYYRHVVAKRTFSYVDTQVFRALWAWIKRRHPQKSALWRKNRYFRLIGLRQWVFFARVRDAFGQVICLDLVSTASLPIVRHVKVQARATPYDPAYADYFAHRARRRRRTGSAAQV